MCSKSPIFNANSFNITFHIDYLLFEKRKKKYLLHEMNYIVIKNDFTKQIFETMPSYISII